jgi:hypothetical protein
VESEETALSRQRIGRFLSAAKNVHAIFGNLILFAIGNSTFGTLDSVLVKGLRYEADGPVFENKLCDCDSFICLIFPAALEPEVCSISNSFFF